MTEKKDNKDKPESNHEETAEQKLSNDRRWDRLRRMVEKGSKIPLHNPGP